LGGVDVGNIQNAVSEDGLRVYPKDFSDFFSNRGILSLNQTLHRIPTYWIEQWLKGG
jgi:hypothetical protein